MSGLFGGGQYEGPSEAELASERELEMEKIKFAQQQQMVEYERDLQAETVAQEEALENLAEEQRSLLSEKLLEDTNRAAKEANKSATRDERKRLNLLNMLEGEDGSIPQLGDNDPTLSSGKDAMFKRKVMGA